MARDSQAIRRSRPDARAGVSKHPQAPNPVYGQIAVGTLASSQIPYAQLLRPYPQFTGVTADLSDWAASRYDALEVKIEKRYARGLNLLAAYTWSKNMDQGIPLFNGESLGGYGVQD